MLEVEGSYLCRDYFMSSLDTFSRKVTNSAIGVPLLTNPPQGAFINTSKEYNNKIIKQQTTNKQIVFEKWAAILLKMKRSGGW